MVTNISTGLLSYSLSQASILGSDQSSIPRSIMLSLSVPDRRQLSSYGGLATSGLSMKKNLRQPGDFFVFEGRGRIEKEGGVKRKINLQSSGTSQFLSLYTGGSKPHSKVHGPFGLPRLCRPVRGTAASPLPTPGHRTSV